MSTENLSFQRVLINILMKRNLTPVMLADKLEPTPLISWTMGETVPTKMEMSQLINVLELPAEEGAVLISSWREENIKRRMAKDQLSVSQLNKPQVSEKFEEELQGIQHSLALLTTRIETVDTVKHDASELENELQQLKDQISNLSITGKELAAPIVLPPMDDMRVKLVTTNSLERLEEYRSNQGLWSAFGGIFLGAILGIVINWATGAQKTVEAWVLVISFTLVVCIFAYFFIQDGKRIEVVKNKMFNLPAVPISKTLLTIFLEKCILKIFPDPTPISKDTNSSSHFELDR